MQELPSYEMEICFLLELQIVPSDSFLEINWIFTRNKKLMYQFENPTLDSCK